MTVLRAGLPHTGPCCAEGCKPCGGSVLQEFWRSGAPEAPGYWLFVCQGVDRVLAGRLVSRINRSKQRANEGDHHRLPHPGQIDDKVERREAGAQNRAEKIARRYAERNSYCGNQ